MSLYPSHTYPTQHTHRQQRACEVAVLYCSALYKAPRGGAGGWAGVALSQQLAHIFVSKIKDEAVLDGVLVGVHPHEQADGRHGLQLLHIRMRLHLHRRLAIELHGDLHLQTDT